MSTDVKKIVNSVETPEVGGTVQTVSNRQRSINTIAGAAVSVSLAWLAYIMGPGNYWYELAAQGVSVALPLLISALWPTAANKQMVMETVAKTVAAVQSQLGDMPNDEKMDVAAEAIQQQLKETRLGILLRLYLTKGRIKQYIAIAVPIVKRVVLPGD